jgi:hypothetical protein
MLPRLSRPFIRISHAQPFYSLLEQSRRTSLSCPLRRVHGQFPRLRTSHSYQRSCEHSSRTDPPHRVHSFRNSPARPACCARFAEFLDRPAQPADETPSKPSVRSKHILTPKPARFLQSANSPKPEVKPVSIALDLLIDAGTISLPLHQPLMPAPRVTPTRPRVVNERRSARANSKPSTPEARQQQSPPEIFPSQGLSLSSSDIGKCEVVVHRHRANCL